MKIALIILITTVLATVNVNAFCCDRLREEHAMFDTWYTCIFGSKGLNSSCKSSDYSEYRSVWYFKAENDVSVTELPVGVGELFPNMQKYYARNCAIKFIKRENFQDLNKVDYLDLQNNELTTIPSGVFDDLTTDWIILTGNKISSIEIPFLAPRKGFLYIDFRNNTCINQLFYSSKSCNKYVESSDCANRINETVRLINSIRSFNYLLDKLKLHTRKNA